MSNTPTHLRASSSSFNFSAQQPEPQPQPQVPAPPVNVMVGSRPSMVSTPERAFVPTAGGFQRRQSATPPEDHKALPGASLPAVVFTPLKQEQSVDSAVGLVIEGAKTDMEAMRSGFAKLLSTRVQAGAEYRQVATALLQSIELQVVPGMKDGKHQAEATTTDTADTVLRAALAALRGLPSVDMDEVLLPMLAQSGRPDALLRAWFHAQTNAAGEINGAFWTAALEVLDKAATQANKSAAWVGQALDGVVSALDDHLAAAEQAWTQAVLGNAVDEAMNDNLGIPTALTPAIMAQRTAALKRFDAAKKSPDALVGALCAHAGRFNASQLGVAVVHCDKIAARHSPGQGLDPQRSAKTVPRFLDAAFAKEVGLQDIGRAAAAIREARLTVTPIEEPEAVLRDMAAAIQTAVDRRIAPQAVVDGTVVRSLANIDTQRTLKGLMVKAVVPGAVPQAQAQAPSQSQSQSQSSSTTTQSSSSSS